MTFFKQFSVYIYYNTEKARFDKIRYSDNLDDFVFRILSLYPTTHTFALTVMIFLEIYKFTVLREKNQDDEI